MTSNIVYSHSLVSVWVPGNLTEILLPYMLNQVKSFLLARDWWMKFWKLCKRILYFPNFALVRKFPFHFTHQIHDTSINLRNLRHLFLEGSHFGTKQIYANSERHMESMASIHQLQRHRWRWRFKEMQMDKLYVRMIKDWWATSVPPWALRWVQKKDGANAQEISMSH